ncbi:YIP1 family protein [Tabrizicola sp. J26]|uniref:Yip1 family protein n=1 Tax=Alitabrizicola rongguiensis TaxID=2909234 RepID=UPI001F1CD462|nr:Yip1 family protein [Tabrizicola rongguiensis]MCF1709916.1 YIP1 family protein [Tabrizicola rongguiensis]
MAWSLDDIWSEARLTLSDPRLGARRILALNLPMAARWTAVGAISAISAVLFHVALRLLPTDGADPVSTFAGSPLFTALLQGFIIVAGAAGIFLMGRIRGGRGSFPDALILFCWLQALMLVLQVLQILAFILVPLLGDIASLAIVVVFFWLLTSFTMELHGFTSRLAVLAGIVLVFFGVAFVLSVILLMFGLGPEMGP